MTAARTAPERLLTNWRQPMPISTCCTTPVRKDSGQRISPDSAGPWTKASAQWWRWTPTDHTSQSNCVFLLAALDRSDLVIGSRWVPGSHVTNWPKSRQLLSRSGNSYARLMLGVGLRDLTAGYRVYRDTALRRIGLENLQSQGYSFQVDLTVRALRAGLVVTELPLTFVDGATGTGKMSGAIVAEALWRITQWGVTARWRRLVTHPRVSQPRGHGGSG
jgi:hypothetical protein